MAAFAASLRSESSILSFFWRGIMVSFWYKLTAAAGHEQHRQRLESKLQLGDQLRFRQVGQSWCYMAYLKKGESKLKWRFIYVYVKILSGNYTSGTQIRPNDNYESTKKVFLS